MMHISPFPFAAVLLATLAFSACNPATPPDSGDASSSSSSSFSKSSMSSATHETISISEPISGETVVSPLTVKGTARGLWYFEASFPVRLLDADGNEIAVAQAQAQSDWMTTDFVPFTSTLTFAAPSGTSGTLELSKDNPSGDPANAESIRIPVKF